MKTLLILFLALMTLFASAMSMHRPFRKPVPHPVTTRPVVTKRPANTTYPVEVKRPVNTTHPVETTRPVEKSNPVSWKTIAAGGAATGTVVAAYKVSNGVEEGMKIAAKEKPEVFADTLSVLTWPIRWTAFILFLLSGCWIWKKWLEHKITTPKGSKPWKSF